VAEESFSDGGGQSHKSAQPDGAVGQQSTSTVQARSLRSELSSCLSGVGLVCVVCAVAIFSRANRSNRNTTYGSGSRTTMAMAINLVVFLFILFFEIGC